MSNSEKKHTESAISIYIEESIHLSMTGDVQTDSSILSRLYGEVVDVFTKDGSKVSGQVWEYFTPDENGSNRASIFISQKDNGYVVELYQNEIDFINVRTAGTSQLYFPS